MGTVSHVINSPEVVAPGTRERGQRAIERLRFHPSTAARNLSVRRSFMVAYPIYESGPESVMGESFRELVSCAAGLLALTTILAYYFIAESNLAYRFKRRDRKRVDEAQNRA